MKLYIHWEGDPPFTKVAKLPDVGTVADLQQACWDALLARVPHQATGGPAAVRFRGPNRRMLPLSSQLTAALTSGDDVFFTVVEVKEAPAEQQCPPKADLGNRLCGQTCSSGHQPCSSGSEVKAQATDPAVSTPPTATTLRPDAPGGSGVARSPEPPAEVRDVASGPAAPAPASAPSSDDQAMMEHLLPLVRTLWLRAEAAAQQQNFRSAGDVLQQALLLAPKPSQAAHLETLARLAKLCLAAGNPAAALPWALRAVEARPEKPAVLELAGDCLREAGRPREAALHYQTALEVLEEEQQGGSDDSGDANAAGVPSSTTQIRLRLSLAACMYDVPGSITPPYDNQDLAASLVMAVLERDPGHWDALRLYGRIALDRGIRDDALRVALRLVVARPQHSGAKALLAECLQDEAGCRQLFEEIGAVMPGGFAGAGTGTRPGAGASCSSSSSSGSAGSSGDGNTAAALGFVATAIKDHGQVASCITLLQHAVRLDPRNASYSLNLVHALELRQDLQGAVEAAQRYCRASGSDLAGLALQDVDTLLSDLPELCCASQLSWYLSQPLWAGGAAQLGAPAESAPAPQLQACGVDGEGSGGNASGGEGCNEAAASPAGSSGGTSRGRKETSQGDKKATFTADQLDELALLFTVAKVLFVGGALTAAARLCDLVEPVRRASAVELHTTLIRNEAAYFGCVLQLLRDHPPPPAQPPPSSEPSAAQPNEGVGAGEALTPASEVPVPLYLCGDSHCLSAAWRGVALRGEQRLLRPLLVTGCKVWHLRPASVFYPKMQFEATLRLVPDGAQVVLVLGEIDCREGLLLAVQKGKYDSVAEGISATVSIYLDIMRRLISERSLELFIHPVPPVLNETRHIVMPFTTALKKAVAAARATDPALARKLHYLDFFQELLAPAPAQTPVVERTTACFASPAADVQLGLSPTRTSEAARVAGAEEMGQSAAGMGADGRRAAASAVVEGAKAPAGWVLRQDLVFDGTHLAPGYVPLLEAALQTAA